MMNSDKMEGGKHPSSFRDPSGYIFIKDGKIYRRVNASYLPVFSKFIETGLYDKLVQEGLLIPHEIIEDQKDYLIIKPQHLELITYPHEWSFSQIKDAALLTLNVHRLALESGMVLKDATAFNVQFYKGKPIFIDTLSFEEYREGDPWWAYGQFCRYFLSLLLLMKYISPNLNELLVSYLDGIPLEIASRMLPAKTYLSPFILANIHIHARKHNEFKESFDVDKNPTIASHTQKNIVQSMIDYISDLSLNTKTEWSNYYNITNYDDVGFKFKEEFVKGCIEKYGLKKIWDVGGNNGHFSRVIQDDCEAVICTDIDPVAVDQNYCLCKKNNEIKITPLFVDFVNPSPGIGFANEERSSFYKRIKELNLDCILALALVHHLSISANCTFEMQAKSFSRICDKLLVEFVAPEDSWAQKLLESKRNARNLFVFYNRKNFESIFKEFYDFLEVKNIPNSKRTLYMMSAKTKG